MNPVSSVSSQWYMLTVIGNDQPGIVARLTAALFQAGVNLGETSMIRLGGNFTIMMMVQSNNGMDKLQSAIADTAESLSLRVHIDPIEAHLHSHLMPDVEITVYGADRAGIVAEVTGALFDAGLNILDLNSDVAGTEAKPVYIMIIEGHATRGMEPLEQALSKLKNRGIEVTFTPIDTLMG
ncbi:MAG: amino acid-binding protein [Gammaproteobacteria bacterium]|nr:amino acid-binding protein [Gammaproteobacteria bacterium]